MFFCFGFGLMLNFKTISVVYMNNEYSIVILLSAFVMHVT